jgi:hypothetical protein
MGAGVVERSALEARSLDLESSAIAVSGAEEA